MSVGQRNAALTATRTVFFLALDLEDRANLTTKAAFSAGGVFSKAD
jgi:hypothetical protein